VYVCPEHPEVTSSAPGTCPKHGTKLLPLPRALVPQDKKLLLREPADNEWVAIENRLVDLYARRFDEWILLEDVTKAVQRIVEFLEKKGAVEHRADLLAEPVGVLARMLDSVRSIAGGQRPTIFQRIWERLEDRN